MTVNVPLLRKTLEHVESHPEEWDQGVYRCGTAMCFAGHAATLDGARWTEGSYIQVREDDGPTAFDSELHVAIRAERILGLDDDQAEALFAPDNTLDDLRRIVAELSEGAP